MKKQILFLLIALSFGSTLPQEQTPAPSLKERIIKNKEPLLQIAAGAIGLAVCSYCIFHNFDANEQARKLYYDTFNTFTQTHLASCPSYSATMAGEKAILYCPHIAQEWPTELTVLRNKIENSSFIALLQFIGGCISYAVLESGIQKLSASENPDPNLYTFGPTGYCNVEAGKDASDWPLIGEHNVYWGKRFLESHRNAS